MRLDDAALRRARRHLAAADPVMARLVREIGPVPMRAHRGGSAFPLTRPEAELGRLSVARLVRVAALG